MLAKYVEPVQFKRAKQFDDDGFPIKGTGGSSTVMCRVQPLVLEQDIGRDHDGTFTELRIFAPAGTPVDSETVVTVRGKDFQVKEPPHDWSQFRRPLVASHRPSVVFVAQRGEG